MSERGTGISRDWSRRPHPIAGATGHVVVLDQVVVKVPKPDSVAIASLRTDVTVSQIALARGIRAARLIAFDETRDFLPVPFAIFARVPGQTLEAVGRTTLLVAPSWEATGRQLARIHAIAPGDPVLDALRRFEQTSDVDPLPWVEQLAAEGTLTPATAATCRALISRLAGSARQPGLGRFCHGDLNAANVIVAPDDPEQVTLIDWAGAGWLDPVWDLVGVPLAAVPPIFRGHRACAPLPDDRTAEARLIWCRLQVALHNALNAEQAPESPPRRLAATIDELAQFADRANVMHRGSSP